MTLTLAMALAAHLPARAATSCSARSDATRMPLVELYTAEGCSSCPPADHWLGTLAPDVAALAFHVDYWNDDGWVDPFSDAAYTQRQSYRIRLAGKKSLVTPAVMVDVNAMVNWREPAAVVRVLRSARQGVPEVDLALQGRIAADALELSLSAQPGAGQPIPTSSVLWLALFQNSVNRRITGGENRGVSLRHTNVVRRLAGPWELRADGARGSLKIPLKGLDPADLGVVLFAESTKDAHMLQSLVMPLRDCN